MGSKSRRWSWSTGALLLACVVAAGTPAVPGGAVAAEPPDGGQPILLRATGNEPFWHLRIDADLIAFDVLGREILSPLPTPRPIELPGSVVYWTVAGAEPLLIWANQRLCRDSMTGMPHPQRVTVRLGDERFHGCGGDPLALFADGFWELVALDGRAVLDGPRPTVAFSADGTLAGHTSCNHYHGRYLLTGESLTVVGRLITTKRLCVDQRMGQEQRLLELLGAMQRFDLDSSGALLLYTADDRVIRARRPDSSP